MQSATTEVIPKEGRNVGIDFPLHRVHELPGEWSRANGGQGLRWSRGCLTAWENVPDSITEQWRIQVLAIDS